MDGSEQKLLTRNNPDIFYDVRFLTCYNVFFILFGCILPQNHLSF